MVRCAWCGRRCRRPLSQYALTASCAAHRRQALNLVRDVGELARVHAARSQLGALGAPQWAPWGDDEDVGEWLAAMGVP